MTYPRVLLLLAGFLWIFAADATAQEINCNDGVAGDYPCLAVHLLSHMSVDDLKGGRNVDGNDIWGWTDPETGKEYALVGLSDGTAFVDVSTPGKPILVGNLPTHTENSDWRDIKVYKDHAFIVSEAGDHGMQIFDLTNLREAKIPAVFSETAHYGRFGRAHNVVINEASGYAYAVGSATCGGGLHMVDINVPAKPVNAGCFSDDGYTHDAQCVIYNGLDSNYKGREICFNANENTVTIVDVTDKAKPFKVAATGYPSSAYVHQGWLSEDHNYFYQNDEFDEYDEVVGNTRTLIWDLSELEDPQLVKTYEAKTKSIDHNLYIKEKLMYQANYQAGLRILDITKPLEPVEVGFFDTYPRSDDAAFNGAWSVYPYFKSGIVVVSTIEDGLYVLKPELSDPGLPVELTQFETLIDGEQVLLQWATASELNNAGFEVQQSSGSGFETIGFVEGQGTTNNPQQYTFPVAQLKAGMFVFRLKQVDFDGTFAFSDEIEVTIEAEQALFLSEAYPNPFNPVTAMTLSVAKGQRVSVDVYNIQGQKVKSLYNDYLAANQAYEIRFEAGSLPSGSYLIRASGDQEIASRLITLVK